jgi:hypothetical protein
MIAASDALLETLMIRWILPDAAPMLRTGGELRLCRRDEEKVVRDALAVLARCSVRAGVPEPRTP